MSSYDEEVSKIGQVSVLVYAPPAYGKSTFVGLRSDDYGYVDTDSLVDDPLTPGSDVEVLITNDHSLVRRLQYSVCLFFLPSRQIFEDGCRHRGLHVQQHWYTDVVVASLCATCIITDGSPIDWYKDFIEGCVDHDCGERLSRPALPTSPDMQLWYRSASFRISPKQDANDIRLSKLLRSSVYPPAMCPFSDAVEQPAVIEEDANISTCVEEHHTVPILVVEQRVLTTDQTGFQPRNDELDKALGPYNVVHHHFVGYTSWHFPLSHFVYVKTPTFSCYLSQYSYDEFLDRVYACCRRRALRWDSSVT